MSTAAPPWLGPDAVASVPPAAAVDALAAAFARGVPEVPQRLHLEVPGVPSGGELLVMPAADDGWAVTKVVGLAPGNPDLGLPRVTSVVVLLGPPGLAPVALIDGAALTALRTAAVSTLATELLARPGARDLVVIGAGVQAEAHARAHAALHGAARIGIVARRAEAAERLAGRLSADGIGAVAAGPDAIATADVIATCTTGTGVVLRGADLPPGVHVNAVGAHRPDLRELDGAAVAACAVAVETRSAALAEKGDLLLAESEGGWSRADIRADLGELCGGHVAGRQSPDERTLFASVGHAFEDLVVAREVLRGRADMGRVGGTSVGADRP